MKKKLVVFAFLILFCSSLAAPLMLQQIWVSQGDSLPKETAQPTPQTTEQSKPQKTPQAITTNTPQPTQQPPTNPQPTQITLIRYSNRTLDEAIGNATIYLQGTSEPYAFLWLNVAYRRFNITAFNDSLQRYDQALAQSYQENQSLLRLFRRIADYNNPLQNGDMQAVTSETDELTVPALYCNRYGLPPNYAATLAQAVSNQDYLVTHALLATIWVYENGLTLSLPLNFYGSLYDANAALINDDGVVTDLEIEAATFLTMSGQNTMINPKFIENVIEAQNRDGGWQTTSIGSEGSNWHSSVLAFLFLLHQKYPLTSYPPMLATTQPSLEKV